MSTSISLFLAVSKRKLTSKGLIGTFFTIYIIVLLSTSSSISTGLQAFAPFLQIVMLKNVFAFFKNCVNSASLLERSIIEFHKVRRNFYSFLQNFIEIRGLKRLIQVCCKIPECSLRSCIFRPPSSENVPAMHFQNSSKN